MKVQILTSLKLFSDNEHEEYEGFVLLDKCRKIFGVQDIKNPKILLMDEKEVRKNYFVQEIFNDAKEICINCGKPFDEHCSQTKPNPYWYCLNGMNCFKNE